jgi:hypothetical protein
MLGGLATFAMALACWILQFVFKAASPIDNTKHALYIIFIFIACMMTMFVNPIGWELQRTWFKLIGSGTLAEHVPEHSPMSLARGGDVAVLGFAVLYLIVLAGAGRPRLTWLIPIPWLIMSVTSIRNGPLFVAVAAVMIAEIWPQTVWYRRLRMSGEMLAIPPTPLTACDLKMMIVPATIVIAGFAIQHFQIPIPIIGSGWARHDPMYVPMDMAPQIRNIPHGSRIYNDPNFGGFLIWHTPGCKIFFDDRFELCGDQFLNDYVNVVYEEPRRFDDWQRQYGFQWAFVHKEKPAALIEHLRQHPDWVIVDEGSTTMLLRFSPRFPTPRTGSTR